MRGMRLDLHLYLHEAGDIAGGLEARLDAISAQLAAILTKEDELMASIDDIAADMTTQTTLLASLASFVQGLKDQIEAALSGATLPPAVQAKVDAVFAQAEANNAAIAAAMVANTPVADVPVS